MFKISWFDISSLELPEYKERHIFVAKLRVLIFISFWIIYVYYTRGSISTTWPVIATVLFSFVLTGVAYVFILKSRFFKPSLWLELIADTIAITATIYVTGGPYSPYFTLYILYCLSAGLFFHYKLAIIAGLISAASYGFFIILCTHGIIPPIEIHYSSAFPSNPTPTARWIILMASMMVAAYALKISGYFQKRREYALESRNRELAALHRMSSIIRRAISLQSVVDQLLSGVLEGLNLKMALLLIFDHDAESIKLFTPKHHPRNPKLNNITKKHSKGVLLPWEMLNKPAFSDILKGRTIYRNKLDEILFNNEKLEHFSKSHNLHDMLGQGRVVGVPLVSAHKVLGALICLSNTEFVEEKFVQRLEAFANQAALFLEAAALIDNLKISKTKLEEASKAKSEFLAMMGHELRTPLTAIIGFSEVLLEGVMGSINDEQKECVDEVVRNGRDLLTIINTLLDLSKTEAGKVKIEPEPVDWAQLIDEVRRTIKPLSDNKKINIQINLSNNVTTTYVDIKKIQQVLINLFSNAVKYTPGGGLITLQLNHYNSWTELPLSFKGKYNDKYNRGAVTIVIEDTGIGIDLDHLEKIFEPFHQVDSSTTRSYAGTGLGLALVKQYVKLHGGVVWAENRKEKGTRFVVVLPDLDTQSYII